MTATEFTTAFDYATGTDPLGRDVAIDHVRRVTLFGVPLLIETNSAYVADLAADLFMPSAALLEIDESAVDTDAASAGPPPMRFRIIVEPDRDGDPSATRNWRYPDADHCLAFGAGAFASLDLVASSGALFVEERVVRERDGEALAYGLLHGMILMLPTRRDRHPVHAAALRVGDRALILQGRSGAGKSTLCYLASRAGIEVLADDAIRIQRTPSLRVWGGAGNRSDALGNALHIHVRPDVRERYAELRDYDALALRNTGVLKYVVPIARQMQAARPPFVSRVRVCLIASERRSGPITCEPISEDEIVETILSAPESWSDYHPAGREPAVRAIAQGGGWRLTLSSDPEAALPFLRDMLSEIRA